MRRIARAIIIGALLAACGAPAATPAAQPTATAVPEPTGGLQATPTVPAPATGTPEPTPIWGDWPGPIRETGLEQPPAEPVLIDGERPPAYLILGADWQPGRNTYNTDTIIIAIAHERAGTVSLFSLPRDLLVFVPGAGMERINQVFALHGAGALADSIEYATGVRVDATATTEMTSFRVLVNGLRGIDITPAADLNERCMGRPFQLEAGLVYHLDGAEALCYARNRATSSDFGRMPRQQEILAALADRIIGQLSPDTVLTTGRALWDFYLAFVWTDADWTREATLAARMLAGGWGGFRYHSLGEAETSPVSEDAGLGPWLLMGPGPERMHELFQAAAEGE